MADDATMIILVDGSATIATKIVSACRATMPRTVRTATAHTVRTATAGVRGTDRTLKIASAQDELDQHRAHKITARRADDSDRTATGRI